MNIWSEIDERLKSGGIRTSGPDDYLRVNAHIHTPYSYSSFDSVDSLIKEARKENIRALGINDFNTVDGYAEWADKCLEAGIFPLFNIEMIGLNKDDRGHGRKVNDPNNPGRTYISGKALSFPLSLSEENKKRLDLIRDLSNQHVRKMTDKVNSLIRKIDPALEIDFDEMLREYTKGMVRERHLAGMIRLKIEEKYPDKAKGISVLSELPGIDSVNAETSDNAGLENLIRSKLLKAGGAAFVEEDPEIFIDTAEIREIILDGGGIPTYPFLADFSNGMYTDFESDREKAAEMLLQRGFYSIEFIPGRNEYERFRDYAMFLNNKGFMISFGTEHNSPGIKPVEVFAEGRRELDDELLQINYESACIMAAHQYLNATGNSGYLDSEGLPKTDSRKMFIDLGNSLIKTVCCGF